jgi:hypothetical protein
LSTGPDGLSGVLFYLEGKTHAFKDVKKKKFDWVSGQKANYIKDKRQKFDGKIVVTVFTVLEGAGAFSYVLEPSKDI